MRMKIYAVITARPKIMIVIFRQTVDRNAIEPFPVIQHIITAHAMAVKTVNALSMSYPDKTG